MYALKFAYCAFWNCSNFVPINIIMLDFMLPRNATELYIRIHISTKLTCL